jgi:hypothetical protein
MPDNNADKSPSGSQGQSNQNQGSQGQGSQKQSEPRFSNPISNPTSDKVSDNKGPKAPVETIMTTGAFGGVPSRTFPTNVASVFSSLPGSGLGGIKQPIAYRPPTAPMLRSASFHSNAIIGSPTAKGMLVTAFERGKSLVNNAAIDRATHVMGHSHATFRRRILRGT